VDLSHDLPPGDVAGASHLLAAAAPTFPENTVHLSVVDPGVGSNRKILAVEAGGRSAGARFVAPDNGLLTPVLQDHSETEPRIHAVTREDLFLASPGQTFHARDRFAPVAAYLLRGEPLEELGPPIDDPVLLEVSAAVREDSKLTGQVAHIDRFGNLVTDIPADWLPHDRAFSASIGAHSTGLRVDHYREIPGDEPGVLTGSLGTLELSLEGQSLAERWRVERGQTLVVRLRGGDPG
jgi:S-adenosylmethionine hydrolase